MCRPTTEVFLRCITINKKRGMEKRRLVLLVGKPVVWPRYPLGIRDMSVRE
jgi:hypothetical protein